MTLFFLKILGLVTKFGGMNFMAIRCSENNIQAAIGVGEKLFNLLSKDKKIIINGENQIIKTNNMKIFLLFQKLKKHDENYLCVDNNC